MRERIVDGTSRLAEIPIAGVWCDAHNHRRRVTPPEHALADRVLPRPVVCRGRLAQDHDPGLVGAIRRLYEDEALREAIVTEGIRFAQRSTLERLAAEVAPFIADGTVPTGG